MVEASASHEDRQKVWDLIKDIQVALLVTQNAGDAELRARPMVALNGDFSGSLWFASRRTAPKLADIADNAHVLLAYSEPKHQTYVSLAGTARVDRDRTHVKNLWRESMRVWFPKGPEDPEIALIEVHVDSAEFWDAPSSTWVYAKGYLKARLTGAPPKDVGENKVVRF